MTIDTTGNADRRPHVVHVTTVPQTLHRLFPPLIKYLTSRGFRSTAVCSKGTWLTREVAEAEIGIPIHEVPLERTISPLRDLRCLFSIVRLFLREKPTIVHSHTPKGGLIGTLAAFISRRPLALYTVRGLPHVTASGLTRRLLMASEWLSCTLADSVICVSQSVSDDLVEHGLCRASKIIVPGAGSAQGVDTEQKFNPNLEHLDAKALRATLQIPDTALIIGFVGRITQDKGVRELSEIWSSLRDQFDVHLVILGADKEPRSGITVEDFRAFEVDERVHNLGVVEGVTAYYKLFDLLLFPSHREGLPNAVLEAAAMEVPVIAWDVVGSKDAVVHEETGYLVPFGDVDQYIEYSQRVLKDADLRDQLGGAARRWVVTAFRPMDRYQQLADLYASLLSEKGVRNG